MIVYLKKSNKSGKKFMVYVDGKTIHFGASGMSDYTKHKDKERMLRYTARHKNSENWTKSGIKTAGFWSKWLLWNKPSLEASKRNISSRFGVRIINGWPKKSKMRFGSKKVSRKSKRSKKVSKKVSRKSKRSKKVSRKSKKVSRKSKRSSKKVNPKWESCVLKVKSKQPKRCSKGGRWKSGSGCYNPFAVCSSRLKRYL